MRMESWSDEFFNLLEVLATEVEQFFTDVAKEVSTVVDAIVITTEEAMDQMQVILDTEVERQLNDWIDPIVELCLTFESTVETAAQPIVHTIDPLMSDQPACVGCRHYHGQMYGGNLLVCGMHPYGWQDDKCPDWQSTWGNSDPV